MPCCVRQRNKAFDMAGDELADTGCVVNGRITPPSVTRPSANTAVTMNRCIVLYPQYVAGESAKCGSYGRIYLLMEERSVLAAVLGRWKHPGAAAARGHVTARPGAVQARGRNPSWCVRRQ